MAKISANPILLLIRKRCYRVVGEFGRLGPGETVARKGVGVPVRSGEGDDEVPVKAKEEVFWMKDPKTGNWIPENHFGEIDAAELRNKHLSNSNNKLTPTKLD